MKLIFYFATVALASVMPSIAQTDTTSHVIAPRHTLSAAEIRKILSGVRVGGGPLPRTPEQKALEDAKLDKINDLMQSGTEALHLKNFAAAEADYRKLLQITAFPQMAPETMLGPAPYYGLGEALAGQGKTADAIAAYKMGVYYPLNFTPEAIAIMQARGNKSNLRGCCGNVDALAWMKYALLLSQAGQNVEAFWVYSQAMPCVSDDVSGSNITLLSAADAPSPSAFQAAVHVALGLLDGSGLSSHEQAMSEFEEALRLAPDAAVTNYYYGYGWQRLDLNSPARAANALQAKAALAKAAASDDANIKKAASEAFKRMP